MEIWEPRHSNSEYEHDILVKPLRAHMMDHRITGGRVGSPDRPQNLVDHSSICSVDLRTGSDKRVALDVSPLKEAPPNSGEIAVALPASGEIL
jgi:hypothetical protein